VPNAEEMGLLCRLLIVSNIFWSPAIRPKIDFDAIDKA